jgi:hypothetical protein
MAPQTSEYWTKVALLGGLAVVCAASPLLAVLRSPSVSPIDGRPALTAEASAGPSPRAPLAVSARAGLLATGAVVIALVIGAAGTWKRGDVVPVSADVLGRALADVDPATFPTITVEQDVVDWNHEIDGDGAQEIVLTLVENLHVENQALLEGDASILEAVDHGDRLDEMRDRLDEGQATGTTVIRHYQIDDVTVTLLVPFGRQDGLSLGLETTGTVVEETYGASGGLEDRASSPFATTFAMRRATGARWLNVGAFASSP